MGKIRLVLIAGVVLLAGAVAFFFMKSGPPPPAIQSVQPGDGSGFREQAAVEIYPEKQQLAGIKTVDVAMVSLKKTVRTTGRVEFDERKLTTVNIKVDGWIEKLYADYSGKYVRKGEPLADIFSPELVAVQLEYLNLTKWKKEQLSKFQRSLEFSWGDRYGTTGRMITWDHEALIEVAKQKFELWGFTEEEIRKLDDTREPMRIMTVRSPASGYVYQKPAFRGTRVSPGDKIFDIVDLSTVWVLADLYENEIPLVSVGQPAKITVSSLPGEVLTSKVDFIYPFLIGQTRTARARFVLPNKDTKLKPQMFTDVEIEVDLGTRLAIPRDAVLETGRRQIVYVDVGDGFFQPRQVRLGSRGDQMVEVLEGLKEKERVASRAVFLIDSEAKLKGIGR
jgi:Cu(I)/Ag(I) efflux system membrane fusion protein